MPWDDDLDHRASTGGGLRGAISGPPIASPARQHVYFELPDDFCSFLPPYLQAWLDSKREKLAQVRRQVPLESALTATTPVSPSSVINSPPRSDGPSPPKWMREERGRWAKYHSGASCTSVFSSPSGQGKTSMHPMPRATPVGPAVTHGVGPASVGDDAEAERNHQVVSPSEKGAYSRYLGDPGRVVGFSGQNRGGQRVQGVNIGGRFPGDRSHSPTGGGRGLEIIDLRENGIIETVGGAQTKRQRGQRAAGGGDALDAAAASLPHVPVQNLPSMVSSALLSKAFGEVSSPNVSDPWLSDIGYRI